ncbi:hypothetical protein [Endozoicomonas sp. SCSIO W0465]|uniref:hypothetical protein n=1 Tax=Endozoicomonas sp. SCSIO W0465 TaxID=2918516 RepID=UPI0020754E92|nr:hypothetical protein [Endozoicomonas sp. SCSIO W0465]USE39546.1 hypothetical protein MJO57_16090 [Endozoicomonas sp. SCSIO W0465]
MKALLKFEPKQEKKRLLFCNIGYMKDYKGNTEDDCIEGGGSFVDEEGYGHEVCNFVLETNKKNAFGYVQTSNNGQINIDRLGAEALDEYIRGVDIVFTAKHPEGGTVIIGFYLDAKVYRHYKQFKCTPDIYAENDINGYRICALKENCFLIAPEERTFFIPRGCKGGIGQSNVWYADTPEARFTRRRVLKYIDAIAK